MSFSSEDPTLELTSLREENRRLLDEKERVNGYVRQKVNQLLKIMGTVPLRPEELDDQTLLELDPIGVVASSFEQILAQLHRTNENLRHTHEDLRAVFDSAGVAVLVLSPDRTIRSYNRAVVETLTDGREDIRGLHCFDVICGEGVPPEGCTLTRAIEANARVKRSEIPIGGRLYDVVATPILKDDGSLDHVILVYIDITERHRALDELARSEARYRDLFENANDLIQIADCGGRLLYVNRAWREAMGYGAEELPGLTMDRVLAEACRSAYQDTVRAACEKRGGSVSAETVFVSKGGQQLQLDGNISCSGEGAEGKKLVRAIFRDVTQQRRMEEEIVKVQRLESLGYLAGGIAHDFNNVLTAVVGNINLAKLYEDRGFKVREKLEKAEKALLRAKNLTQKLLTFSQGGEPIRKRLVLDRFVADTAEMALTGSPVRLDFSAQEGLHTVMCDQRQIEQVLQNLVSNASHAMPRGGVLTVRCRNVGAEEARAYPLERGEYVAISIRDEGTGIPRENLGRIFDPFFSTKEGGMGLGLATAYSIAKKHGGIIRVESELGRGSEFTVFLPVASAETEEEKAEVAGRMQGGRILVMDDEEEILDLVKTFLEYAGYEVAIARDGAEAVRLYRDDMERGLPFDLFLTDLTVPGGMGGLEALQRIRTVDRDVLAVVSSGYSDDPVMSGYRNYGFSGVAVKPYRLETLSNLVGTLIGEKRERAGS